MEVRKEVYERIKLSLFQLTQASVQSHKLPMELFDSNIESVYCAKLLRLCEKHP